MSASSSDEAGSVYKRTIKSNSKKMESVPESDSDEELPKIPDPPKLALKKNNVQKSCNAMDHNSQIGLKDACPERLIETKINLDSTEKDSYRDMESNLNKKADYFGDQLKDLRNGNINPLKLTHCSNMNRSMNTDKVVMRINDTSINSSRDINKTSEKRKPTIVQDVTFMPPSSGPPAARVLYTEPALPRDLGNDCSLGSISFPAEHDMLADIIGNQYSDQLTAVTMMIKDHFLEMSNAIGDLNTSVKAIESRLTEIERAVNINATAQSNANQFADIAAAFPFATEVEVMKFEDKIRTDDDRRRVVTYLSQVGGNCAKECIRRLLSKIFSISLANISSWQGQLGNFKVGELKIISIIKDAVRVSYACTDKFYEDEGKEWFRQGTQKYKRAQKKMLQMLLQMLL